MKNMHQWFQFVRHNPDGAGGGVATPDAPAAAPQQNGVKLPPVGVMAQPVAPPLPRSTQAIVDAITKRMQGPQVPPTQPLAEEIVHDAPPAQNLPPVAAQALPNIPSPTPTQPQVAQSVAPTGTADAGLDAFDSAAIESILSSSPSLFANTGPVPVAGTPEAPVAVQQPGAPQQDIGAIIREQLQALLPQFVPQAAQPPVQQVQAPVAPQAPAATDPMAQIEQLSKQKLRDLVFKTPGKLLGDAYNFSTEELYNGVLTGQPKLYAIPDNASADQKAALKAYNDQALRTIQHLQTQAEIAAMREVMAKGNQPVATPAQQPAKTPPSANQGLPIEQAIAKDTFAALDAIAIKGGINSAFSNPMVRGAVLERVYATWDSYPASVPPSEIVSKAMKAVYEANQPVFKALSGTPAQNVQPVTQKPVESQAAQAPTINTVPRTTAPGSAAPSMQQAVDTGKNPHQPGTAPYHQWARENALKRLGARV